MLKIEIIINYNFELSPSFASNIPLHNWLLANAFTALK